MRLRRALGQRDVCSCATGRAAVALAALGLAIDNTTVLTLPGLALVALCRRARLVCAALRLGACAGVALAAVYAYLPLRSAAVTAARIDPTLTLGLGPGRPFWDDGHPATVGRLRARCHRQRFRSARAIAAMFSPDDAHGASSTDFCPARRARSSAASRCRGSRCSALSCCGGAAAGASAACCAGAVVRCSSSAPISSSRIRRATYLPAYFALVALAGYGAQSLIAALPSVQRYAARRSSRCCSPSALYADVTANIAYFGATRDPVAGARSSRA